MPPSSIRVTIDEREVEILRARLGRFLILERYSSDFYEAIKERNSGTAILALLAYLKEALPEDVDLEPLMWLDITTLFITTRALNALPRDVPLLKVHLAEPNSPPWDHKGRPFIMWIHIIASEYGWPLAEIRNLWPEEAVMHVQEILLDEQLEREWEHTLSPVAHSADKQGKDTYKKLRRPAWMSPRPQKQKLLRKTLPQGLIINISGVEAVDLDD
jgi:hypothetical protein